MVEDDRDIQRSLGFSRIKGLAEGGLGTLWLPREAGTHGEPIRDLV